MTDPSWIRNLDYGGPRLAAAPPVPSFSSMLDFLPPPPKRKAFVSYHHAEQAWHEAFTDVCTALDVFTNRSLAEPIDSEDVDYVHRAIRERNIAGTSITIVLCGAETWKRKWVDWEIGSTVNKHHALLGIALPTAPRVPTGVVVPDRFYHNWLTGHAVWMLWENCTPPTLTGAINDAVSRAARYPSDNRWPFMTKNR